MPKKTLALITGLVLVTVVLFVIALRSSQQSTQNPVTTTPATDTKPTVSMAHSVLSLSPDSVKVLPGASGSVDVIIDSSDNEVTGVELDIAFDPKQITNVKVTPKELFQDAVTQTKDSFNINSNQTGRFRFAFAKATARASFKGSGTVASISFTAKSTNGTSKLTLLPTTLITANGVADSVLKEATGATVVVGN